MKSVTASYARAHLPELLDEVSRGAHITIKRREKPIAELCPSAAAIKPVPKFGTGKGKVRLLDPRAFDAMTDEQVEAFVEGRPW